MAFMIATRVTVNRTPCVLKPNSICAFAISGNWIRLRALDDWKFLFGEKSLVATFSSGVCDSHETRCLVRLPPIRARAKLPATIFFISKSPWIHKEPWKVEPWGKMDDPAPTQNLILIQKFRIENVNVIFFNSSTEKERQTLIQNNFAKKMSKFKPWYHGKKCYINHTKRRMFRI